MGKREYNKDDWGRCLPIQLTSYQRALKFPDTDIAVGSDSHNLWHRSKVSEKRAPNFHVRPCGNFSIILSKSGKIKQAFNRYVAEMLVLQAQNRQTKPPRTVYVMFYAIGKNVFPPHRYIID